MKQNKQNNLTAARANKIKQALNNSFRLESCDPKYDAQQNLQGITHWASDDTLRFFRANINCTQALVHGTIFTVENSVPVERCGDKLPKRITAFDLMGTIVFEAEGTSYPQARKEMERLLAEFDAAAHYKSELKAKADRLREESKRIRAAI